LLKAEPNQEASRATGIGGKKDQGGGRRDGNKRGRPTRRVLGITQASRVHHLKRVSKQETGNFSESIKKKEWGGGYEMNVGPSGLTGLKKSARGERRREKKDDGVREGKKLNERLKKKAGVRYKKKGKKETNKAKQ